ncbi:MAG: nucleotidyltransferase family protein [Candidatus Schekmanbacteria bacterium]|nr:nucleotidyltransferase family protein [Candidatus Schekmanbacteria bacterium]
MLKREEIIGKLKKHQTEIQEKYSVKALGIFGSFVRGTQKRMSDIDILVEFEELPDLLRFIELERYLSKILSKKVDLIEKTSLKPRLKEIILKEVVYI